MNNDIETIISENISLKKVLQTTKYQNEKLQRDKQVLLEEKDELQDELRRMKNDYAHIQAKHRNLLAENQKNSTTYVSQIEELKSLIEEKEQQLENIQLKLIPNFDEDMLRVKLIAEMQGPYQEMVDKKDRQILKLKNKIHDLERKNDMLQFSIKNKEQQVQRQLEDTKYFYQSQNDRLMKQITHFTAKEQSRNMDNDLVKSYRKEIHELRSSVEYHQQQDQHSKLQIEMLRTEKDGLLKDLANANVQRALEIHQTSNEHQINSIRKQKSRIQEDLSRYKELNDRLENKLRQAETEKFKLEKKHNEEGLQQKASLEKEKDKMKNQISDMREEIRRLKDIKNRQEEDYLRVCDRYKDIERQCQFLQNQNRSLKSRLSQQIRPNQSSFNTNRIEQSSKKQTERYNLMEKQIRQKILREIRQNESPRRDVDREQTDKDQKIRNLQKKIERLNIKLNQANQKIISLIQEKAKLNKSFRTNEGTIKDNDYIYLENRDCGMMPLCPPTIFTTTNPRRKSHI